MVKVLIVEDDVEIIEDIKYYLEEVQVDISIAGSLAEARARYIADNPDIVILDGTFPREADEPKESLISIEFIQFIKESNRPNSTIIIHSNESQNFLEMMERLGAIKSFSKFDTDKMIEFIKTKIDEITKQQTK